MSPRRIVVAFALFASAAFMAGCQAPGRSVRAWVEARDGDGRSIAGASVAVDGRLVGITDHRGMFRVKIRRRVGTPVSVSIVDERDPPRSWAGGFTVGTNGGPAESPSGRVVAVLEPARARTAPAREEK